MSFCKSNVKQETHLFQPRPVTLLLFTAVIGLHGNSAQPKLKLLSLPAPIAGLPYSVTCAVQGHPLNQMPAIEWVGPKNQTLSTNGNVVVSIPTTAGVTTSRFLLFKVLSLADSGTYKCRSTGTMPPFQLIALDVQADFNDCSLNLHQCGPFASCKPVDEMSSCVCNLGFALNKSTCQDVDECNLQVNTCPKNSFCRNTLGAYDCVCKVGFQLIGGNCIIAPGSKGRPGKGGGASKGRPGNKEPVKIRHTKHRCVGRSKGHPGKTGGASKGHPGGVSKGPIKIRYTKDRCVGRSKGLSRIKGIGKNKGPLRSKYVKQTKRPRH